MGVGATEEQLQLALHVALVGEDSMHELVATTLVRNVLIDAVDWLDSDTYDAVCGAFDFGGGRRLLKWKDVNTEAQARGFGVRTHGRWGAGHRPAYAASARKALLLLNELGIRAAVLIVDLDDDDDRRDGLVAARDMVAAQADLTVVVATPKPEGEAWLLCGFEPEDEEEQRAFAAERMRLHYWPNANAHRLSSKRKQDRRDCKACFDRLVPPHDVARRTRCLGDLTRLRKHGEQTHLRAFLDEIQSRFAPLLRSFSGKS